VLIVAFSGFSKILLFSVLLLEAGPIILWKSFSDSLADDSFHTLVAFSLRSRLFAFFFSITNCVS